MASTTRWLRDAGRSRPLINVLLAALMAVAVSAAVLGPLLVRAIGQSTLQQAVHSAGLDAGAVTVTTTLGYEAPTRVFDAVTRALTPAREGAGAGLWAAPQLWTESTDNLAWGPSKATETGEGLSRVRIADGGCPGLTVATGRCPRAPGEVMVSARDVDAHRADVGTELLLRAGDGYTSAVAVVVGTFALDEADVTLARPGIEAGIRAGVSADPLVMTVRQSADLNLTENVVGRVALRGGLRLQDEYAARAAVGAVQGAVLQQARTMFVDDSLLSLLDRVDAEIRSAAIVVWVSEVQALGLAVFAISVVLQRMARARTSEWAIGRLRGVPRSRWLASIYLEPASALLVGVPFGVLGGWFCARWMVRVVLRADTSVEIARWPVLLAGGLVVVAVLVALVVVSVPNARKPLIELIGQRSEARRLGVPGAVAQSAVVLLAVASIYELLQGGVLEGGGSQLGLLAPGLLALALALVSVRVAVLSVRRITRRPPRRLGALVVGRQSARTPSTLDPAVVVAMGVAIVVFATQILQLSVRNQQLRADAVVGAATVLTVDLANPADLMAAVDAADPDGRYAMAVQERDGVTDTGVQRVVAVDSSRFAAVTAWSPDWADVDVPTALRPSAVPEVMLTGRRVRVRVADVDLDAGGDSSGPAPRPHLTLTVDTGKRWQTVDLGRLGSAPALSSAVPCRAGCRLISLGVQSDYDERYDVSFTVAGISTDTQPAGESYGWLRDPDRWRPRVGDQVSAEPRARATPEGTPAGLAVRAYDRDGATPAVLLAAAAQDPLPAVVTAQSGAEPFAGIPEAASGRGLDGLPQLLTIRGRASVLPRSLDGGVLVDLTSAARLVDPSRYRPTSEVWMAADAPSEIESRLVESGLTIVDRQQRSTIQASLIQQPATRAAAGSVGLGYSALLLALLALIAARIADVSRRRPDWWSLRDSGIAAYRVRGLAFSEIAVPAVLGVVLGSFTGVVASQLAAPRLPLVDQAISGPPLDLSVRWGSVAVTGTAVVIVAVVAAYATAGLETRSEWPEER